MFFLRRPPAHVYFSVITNLHLSLLSLLLRFGHRMVSTASCCVVSHGLLRHRRRQPHRTLGLDARSEGLNEAVSKDLGIRIVSMPASRARMERRRKAREATKILNRVLYMEDARDGEEEQRKGETTDKLLKALDEAATRRKIFFCFVDTFPSLHLLTSNS